MNKKTRVTVGAIFAVLALAGCALQLFGFFVTGNLVNLLLAGISFLAAIPNGYFFLEYLKEGK